MVYARMNRQKIIDFRKEVSGVGMSLDDVGIRFERDERC